MNRAALSRRVQAGVVRACGRGVYSLADHPDTLRSRLRIATLTTGNHAILSGHAAMVWHNIVDTMPRQITVTVPAGHHRRTAVRSMRDERSAEGKRSALPERVRIRYRDLHDSDTVVRSGLLVTALPLSALEGALEYGTEILDAALQLRRVSIAQLECAVERAEKRRDHSALKRLLEGAGSGARSAAERVTVTLFRGAHIDGWIANHPILHYTVDFAFPQHMLIVEIDGMSSHGGADAFQKDRRRRNELTAAGWTVVNFTWGDLIERPDYVINFVRNALAAAA